MRSIKWPIAKLRVSHLNHRAQRRLALVGSPPQPARQPVNNRQAALRLLASAIMFTFTGVLVKTLGETLPRLKFRCFAGLLRWR